MNNINKLLRSIIASTSINKVNKNIIKEATPILIGISIFSLYHIARKVLILIKAFKQSKNTITDQSIESKKESILSESEKALKLYYKTTDFDEGEVIVRPYGEYVKLYEFSKKYNFNSDLHRDIGINLKTIKDTNSDLSKDLCLEDSSDEDKNSYSNMVFINSEEGITAYIRYKVMSDNNHPLHDKPYENILFIRKDNDMFNLVGSIMHSVPEIELDGVVIDRIELIKMLTSISKDHFENVKISSISDRKLSKLENLSRLNINRNSKPIEYNVLGYINGENFISHPNGGLPRL